MSTDVHVGVVSCDRPGSPAKMAGLLYGLEPTWYVPEGQGADYRYSAEAVDAAVRVVELPAPADGDSPLCWHRNLVLDAADGRPCVQLDDDLTPSKRAPTGFSYTIDGKDERVVTAREAIELTLAAMADAGAKLGGGASTTNKFYFHPDRPIGRQHFVIASFCVILPTDLRFDLTLATKEDYDYTLQHIDRYGTVARLNGLFPNFRHYTNPGGSWVTRTEDVDRASARRLIEKWPAHVKLHPTRGDSEVLLRWKP